MGLNPILLAPMGQRPYPTKPVGIDFIIHRKLCVDHIYYGSKPVLFQRMLIGFKAILYIILAWIDRQI